MAIFTPWDNITDFFRLIRKMLALIDFTVDTTAIIYTVGAGFAILIAYWTFLAGWFVVKWLKN